MKTQTLPVFLGFIAIICWGSLATLGNILKHLPPFFVLGVTFLMGSLPALYKYKEMFPSWKITLWGIFGYFGYHFFLFYSFRYAPAVEANLINYLWPMIMVLASPLFFTGTKLKAYHFLGAGLSVVGVGVLVVSKGANIKLEFIQGYCLAFGAALTWPLYSLVKKKMAGTSVWAVGGFCLGAGLLSLVTHALIEPPVTLTTSDKWILAIMGIGPFGIAFYAWDMALAKGDSKVIGALSYLTPVISTLGLVIFAGQNLTFSLIVAMVLIIGGASSGLLDFLLPKDLIK